MVVVAVAWLLLRSLLAALGGGLGESVVIERDGHTTRGLLFRAKAPARTLVVAAHGGLATKESLLSLCWEVRARGADCVVVDVLGHGTSSALPPHDPVGAMRRALRVDRGLGAYDDVRFVGHSMGAYLGAGAAFPCGASIAIGNPVPCGESRIVWGSVHRSLGLSDRFYVLSHVLEPWTPSVVETAVDRLLPGTHSSGGAITIRIALSWASFGAMMLLGLLGARELRRRPGPRGLHVFASVTLLWLALSLGSYRTLWFLLPTQGADVAVVAGIVSVTLMIAWVARLVGARVPISGTIIACIVAESAAMVLWLTNHVPLIGNLLILLPLLTLPLCVVVAMWERVTRSARSDVVESAAFTSALLALFVALLLPT
ncbi:hypothetical protein AKJ09_01928 [Labilithrix luteola]|uniref:Serine aminopeptidase S33 domain-containing protein n=1 Tax=Labilithrix luteola TaxID=1391654 RepID=A0A0K1PQ84_9BACT|nr:alpha/beta hydrolase [Labilithrix luteola]AKU95264.1 hypothetical protein AKJ09_01928 [Labilithrix luteola]